MPFDGINYVPRVIQRSLFSRFVRCFRTKKQKYQSEMVASFLSEAKALIADPRYWIQGQMTLIDNEGITKRCTLGALTAVSYRYDLQIVNLGVHYLAMFSPNIFRKTSFKPTEIQVITMMNDRNTHEYVMNVFDKAVHYL